MSRDCYETTIATPDTVTGLFKALTGVRVYVVPRGVVDYVTAAGQIRIYQADTGNAQGADPKSGATGTNPITTAASGAVRFWADGPFEYDLVLEDTVAPARISDRIGWNAVPAKPGTTPTSSLASDGGITQKMLSPEVIRQEVAIGMIDDWWRPSNVVPVPDGYEVCDGHQVTQHDFPGVTGPINTPDLRNAFILGADVAKNDASAATGADGSGNGPGIRGAGGAHQVTLVATQIPAHPHPVTDPGHIHLTDGGNGYFATYLAGSGHVYDSSAAAPSEPRPGSDRVRTAVTGITVGNNTGGDGAHNNMPKYVGLLKIMKCRRY